MNPLKNLKELTSNISVTLTVVNDMHGSEGGSLQAGVGFEKGLHAQVQLCGQPNKSYSQNAQMKLEIQKFEKTSTAFTHSNIFDIKIKSV